MMEKSNKEINRKLIRSSIKTKILKTKIIEAKKLKETIQKAKLALKFEQCELEHQFNEFMSKQPENTIKIEYREDGTNFNEELITDPNPSTNLNEICPREDFNSKDEEYEVE